MCVCATTLSNVSVIIINDGSNDLSTNILKKMMTNLKETCRWMNIQYIENEQNMGLGYSLHKGVLMSKNELIFRMDADDIMITNSSPILIHPNIIVYKNDLYLIVVKSTI